MRTLTITIKIQFPHHSDKHVIDCIEKDLPRVLQNDMAVLSRMAIHDSNRHRGDVEVTARCVSDGPSVSG
jgi:hypothetical protein